MKPILALCFSLLSIAFSLDLSAQWPELEQQEKLLRQYEENSEYDKILAAAKPLQARAKQAKAWAIYCSALSLEGEALRYEGDYEKARIITAQALKETEQYLGKKHLLYGTALFNRARFLDEMQERKGLDSLFEAALAVYRDTIGTETDFYAAALNGYGIYKQEAGDIERAEDLLWQSMDILQRVDTSKESYVVAMGNMAAFLADIGKRKEAESLYLRTIELSEELFGSSYNGKGIDLNNLGSLYMDMDDFRKAEKYLRSAISSDSTELGYSHHYCRLTRVNLVVLYLRIRKYKEVERMCLELLSEKMPASTYAIIHERLAPSLIGAYAALGDLKKADYEAQRYLQLMQTQWGQNSYRISRVYNEMANLYGERELFDSAYYYAELAIKSNSASNDIGQRLREADYASIGNHDFQDLPIIQTTFRHWVLIALQHHTKTPSPENRARVLGICQAALAYSERRRRLLIDEDNQLAILAANQIFIASAVSVLIAGKSLEEQSKAFEMVEQNKALILAAALQSREKAASDKVPADLVNREKDIKTKISVLQAKQLEASAFEDKKTITTQLAQLNIEQEALQKQIRALDTAYYDQRYAPKTLSLQAAQASLPSDALLLEFFISDGGAFLFAATNQKFKAYQIPIKSQEFKDKIDSLRFLVSDMQQLFDNRETVLNDYSKLGHEVYQLLLQEALAEHPESKQLIIVPDRQLWRIPFEALLTAAPSGQIDFKNLPYLIKDYEISYAYSATLLAENQAAIGRLEAAPQKAMLLAADYTLPPPVDKNGPIAGKKNALRRALAPLPAAQQEVETIAKILKIQPLSAQTNGEVAFKSQAADYNIIHLAMHGIVDEKYPVLSSLAFSEIGDEGCDNFLQAHEIAKLRLRARLVVLSACETGTGRFAQGEGAMSLGRAFMYAGVPSLVISLWPVNDGATASLMELFYYNIEQGQAPAKALRQAKLDYLNRCEGLASHPAFWAPFVQLGANQPVVVKSGSAWMWWLGGGTVFVLVLGAFALTKSKKAA